MNLKDALVAHVSQLFDLWVDGRTVDESTQCLSDLLRDLAHDGVLVVDFRTDPAGVVLSAVRLTAWATSVDPDGTPRCYHPSTMPCTVTDHSFEPLYLLVRPNDGAE